MTVSAVAISVLLAVTLFGRQGAGLFSSATKSLQRGSGGGGGGEADGVPSAIPATTGSGGNAAGGAAGGAGPGDTVAPRPTGGAAPPSPGAGAGGSNPPQGEPKTLAEAVERARQFNYDARIQQGAECGFAALGTAMDYWHKQNAANPNPATDGAGGTKDNAIKKGYITPENTYIKVRDLAALARDSGYNSGYKDNATIDDIKDSLKKGRGVIVLQPVDPKGNPTTDSKYRTWGHFSVVEGFVTFQGKEYMIVKNGWSKDSYVWPVDDFKAAWNQSEYKSPMVEVYPK